VLTLPAATLASETRKGESASVRSEETIKGDIFLFGDRVKVDGKVEGDVFLFGHDATVNGTSRATCSGLHRHCRSTGKWMEIFARLQTL